MDVEVHSAGPVTVLRVTGKILGGAESTPLRQGIDEAFQAGVRRVLVDLAGVPWMNSAGLGILLSAHCRLQEAGGRLALSGAGPRVLGILRTTKLLTVLPVLDDEETGIRSFRPGGDPGPVPSGAASP
jgi:anti-sigma B factor antagonist